MGSKRLQICNENRSGVLSNFNNGCEFNQSICFGGLFASLGQVGSKRLQICNENGNGVLSNFNNGCEFNQSICFGGLFASLGQVGSKRLQICNENGNGVLSNFNNGCEFNQSICFGGLFASVGQVGSIGFGGEASPNPSKDNEGGGGGGFKFPCMDLYMKYVEGFNVEEGDKCKKKKKKKVGVGVKLTIKVGNPSLRRLISGAIAGAISRTAVAPLETIRTHLMVGTCGHSTMDVFNDIMKNDGWKGLFRGNFVNVIRVAPSKAIELLAYDTVNKNLSSKPGEQPKVPIPPSLIAGACAGVSSTLCTYPLELVKTRLTIQRGVYNGIVDALVKILREEGPTELYRGLAPSLIGVIPYAATNYFAYDSLRTAYKKFFKEEKIGNIETLLIGSLAGAISSTATFPLEVARKQMQVGAVSGRQVYKNVIHALATILEQEGVNGLYRGLGPSCLKLVPAAGISFMCYEACKRILVENEDEG